MEETYQKLFEKCKICSGDGHIVRASSLFGIAIPNSEAVFKCYSCEGERFKPVYVKVEK